MYREQRRPNNSVDHYLVLPPSNKGCRDGRFVKKPSIFSRHNPRSSSPSLSLEPCPRRLCRCLQPHLVCAALAALVFARDHALSRDACSADLYHTLVLLLASSPSITPSSGNGSHFPAKRAPWLLRSGWRPQRGVWRPTSKLYLSASSTQGRCVPRPRSLQILHKTMHWCLKTPLRNQARSRRSCRRSTRRRHLAPSLGHSASTCFSALEDKRRSTLSSSCGRLKLRSGIIMASEAEEERSPMVKAERGLEIELEVVPGDQAT